jgi:hypothetical protein
MDDDASTDPSEAMQEDLLATESALSCARAIP